MYLRASVGPLVAAQLWHRVLFQTTYLRILDLSHFSLLNSDRAAKVALPRAISVMRSFPITPRCWSWRMEPTVKPWAVLSFANLLLSWANGVVTSAAVPDVNSSTAQDEENVERAAAAVARWASTTHSLSQCRAVNHRTPVLCYHLIGQILFRPEHQLMIPGLALI